MRPFIYARDGESHGPVSPPEFWARGLAPDTLIWLEERNDWLLPPPVWSAGLWPATSEASHTVVGRTKLDAKSLRLRGPETHAPVPAAQ